MSVAVDKKGLKRVCNECGTRFYDLNKRPIECPSCNTEFVAAETAKSRVSKAKSKTEGQVSDKTQSDETSDDDEDEEDDDGLEAVVLDDDDVSLDDDDNDDDDDTLVSLEDLDDDNLDDLDVDDEPADLGDDDLDKD